MLYVGQTKSIVEMSLIVCDFDWRFRIHEAEWWKRLIKLHLNKQYVLALNAKWCDETSMLSLCEMLVVQWQTCVRVYVCIVWRSWTRRPDKNRTKYLLFRSRTLLELQKWQSQADVYAKREKNATNIWFSCRTDFRSARCWTTAHAKRLVCVNSVSFSWNSKQNSFGDRFPCHWIRSISICCSV